jgi:hypothetical protein
MSESLFGEEMCFGLVLSSRSIDQFLQLILSCSVQIADENPICCEYCCQSFSRMSESLLGEEMCFELMLSSRSNDQIFLLFLSCSVQIADEKM